MKKIADYDTVNYDYSTYWEKREYEHKSEIIALKRLLKDVKGQWFLDIGGSYGRLLPIYNKSFVNCIIVDYSLKTLQRNYKEIKQKAPNTYLIAANAYNLPFRNNSFDTSLMVRVLHHIIKPEQYFKEVYRILSPNGIYIQEFANKFHIKAIIKAFLLFDFSLFKKGPYQQVDKGHHEGSRKHVKVPFFNYSSFWIKKNLKKAGLTPKEKVSCSFLRLSLLKNNINLNTLLTIEKTLQYLFSFMNISPSIFIKSTVKKKGAKQKYNRVEDLLVCPSCKNSLSFSNNRAICNTCKKTYHKKDNIWDYRI
jgi:ubiquinone/menaquinone biosynthesis C-methylase UbiE